MNHAVQDTVSLLLSVGKCDPSRSGKNSDWQSNIKVIRNIGEYQTGFKINSQIQTGILKPVNSTSKKCPKDGVYWYLEVKSMLI